jgi:hypothetical protein
MGPSVHALIEQGRHVSPLYGGRSIFGWEPERPPAQTAIGEE